MERLSGLDSAFLSFETRAMHLHVAIVAVIDPTTMATPYTFDQLKDFVSRRLLGHAAFRRRVVEVPFQLNHPIWVEDRPAVERALAPLAVPGTWFTSVLEEAVSPRHGEYEEGSCPRAELAASHLYNLPTHPRVRPEDAVALVDALAAVEHGSRP